MYLTDLVKDLITQKLREECIYHTVEINDLNGNKCKFFCMYVEFVTDEVDCWIKFIDDKNQEFLANGCGLDIYFEIKD